MSPEPMVFVFNEETRLFFRWLRLHPGDWLDELIAGAGELAADWNACLEPGEEPWTLRDALADDLGDFLLRDDSSRDHLWEVPELETGAESLVAHLMAGAACAVDLEALAEAVLQLRGKLPPDEAADESGDRPE